ncbi:MULTISPECIES: formylglycine-generating enzyme family protein [Hydrocarboniphaga]|uniref:Sulfatase-modifying factor enzyme-like domain-containing protein n=1 Tax=Hydrocarboniphaga effusa AP103 TaxID=1172194 RepID=I8T8V1_9GAMM|nr:MULTISPECIES: SUMF1/EgtB/PvdO family nonheme iron enzyme [Hydrocarboniphaga]EIT70395.1 hypothetical protein WQQ_05320 [Hydrocarboniphaga effusa AP103]MDZ4078008.1 SUMF1/EgtB/PvdO family nonheme iron enzyme [Hydrocarboniphaga sp.]
MKRPSEPASPTPERAAAEPRIRPLDLDANPERSPSEALRWVLFAVAAASVIAAVWLTSLPTPSGGDRSLWASLGATQTSSLPTTVAVPAGVLPFADAKDGGYAVQAFAIGRTEVTVEQFRLFVQRSGYQGSSWAAFPCLGTAIDLSWQQPGYGQSDTFPVVCVSAVDAMAYAEWLSAQTGRSFRLPTEIEWEYAARAGAQTRFWWGDTYDERMADCNGCSPNSRARPTFVGSWPANAWGLHDVAGNVREWTCSVFLMPMRSESQHCEQALDETVNLTVRGGSWQESVDALALSDRRPYGAFQRNVWTGFRVVETAAATTK